MRSHFLRLVCGCVLSGGSVAAMATPFEGVGIGVSLGSHSMEVDADFSGSVSYYPGSASGEDDALGVGLRFGYMGRSGNLGYSFDVRYIGSGLETGVFGDDEYSLDNAVTIGTNLGYVSGAHFVYGIVELGSASFDYQVEGYTSESDRIGMAGLGIGYAHAVNEEFELSVELVGRALADYRVDFYGGRLAGGRQDMDVAIGSLSLGALYRF